MEPRRPTMSVSDIQARMRSRLFVGEQFDPALFVERAEKAVFDTIEERPLWSIVRPPAALDRPERTIFTIDDNTIQSWRVTTTAASIVILRSRPHHPDLHYIAEKHPCCAVVGFVVFDELRVFAYRTYCKTCPCTVRVSTRAANNLSFGQVRHFEVTRPPPGIPTLLRGTTADGHCLFVPMASAIFVCDVVRGNIGFYRYGKLPTCDFEYVMSTRDDPTYLSIPAIQPLLRPGYCFADQTMYISWCINRDRMVAGERTKTRRLLSCAHPVDPTQASLVCPSLHQELLMSFALLGTLQPQSVLSSALQANPLYDPRVWLWVDAFVGDDSLLPYSTCHPVYDEALIGRRNGIVPEARRTLEGLCKHEAYAPPKYVPPRSRFPLFGFPLGYIRRFVQRRARALQDANPTIQQMMEYGHFDISDEFDVGDWRNANAGETLYGEVQSSCTVLTNSDNGSRYAFPYKKRRSIYSILLEVGAHLESLCNEGKLPPDYLDTAIIYDMYTNPWTRALHVIHADLYEVKEHMLTTAPDGRRLRSVHPLAVVIPPYVPSGPRRQRTESGPRWERRDLLSGYATLGMFVGLPIKVGGVNPTGQQFLQHARLGEFCFPLEYLDMPIPGLHGTNVQFFNAATGRTVLHPLALLDGMTFRQIVEHCQWAIGNVHLQPWYYDVFIAGFAMRNNSTIGIYLSGEEGLLRAGEMHQNIRTHSSNRRVV